MQVTWGENEWIHSPYQGVLITKQRQQLPKADSTLSFYSVHIIMEIRKCKL